jgi:hypothetical protein
MRCSFSPRCRWKRLREVKKIYITCEVAENERYVITPNSLPTVDELDDFGRKALSMSEGSHSGRMTALLDDFLLLYCRKISCNCSKVVSTVIINISSHFILTNLPATSLKSDPKDRKLKQSRCVRLPKSPRRELRPSRPSPKRRRRLRIRLRDDPRSDPAHCCRRASVSRKARLLRNR